MTRRSCAEVQDSVVLVRCGRSDARPVDPDQPDVVLPRVDPSLVGNLPARPRCPVQPEDSAPLRIAELGEADLAIVVDRDVPLELGPVDVETHG